MFLKVDKLSLFMLKLASGAVAAGEFCKKGLARFRLEPVVTLSVNEFVSSVSELAFHAIAAEIVKLEFLAKLGFVLGSILALEKYRFILWVSPKRAWAHPRLWWSFPSSL